MNSAQHSFWEERTNMQPVKFESSNSNDGEQHPRLKDEPNGNLYNRFCDGNLNFATVACSEDDSEYGHFHKKNKVSRQDPMSHRIIEKRRRDRMNNCLADLSRLIPADYLKKGRGRIEKTEIIEMAIKHMKYLQQTHQNQSVNTEHYRLGFQECMSETMRFLVEVEGFFAREALCVKLINHLQAHCEAILTSDRLHSGNELNQSTGPLFNLNQNQTQLPPPQLRSPMQPRPTPSPVNGQIHAELQPGYEHHNPSHLRDMLSTNMVRDNNIPNQSTQVRDSIPTVNTVENRIHSSNNLDKGSSETNSYSIVRNMTDQTDIVYDFQRQHREREEISSQNGSECNNNSYTIHESSKSRYEGTRPTSDNENNNRECTNGASLYKFKNNIMQRINQESVSSSLSTHNINKIYKRRKIDIQEQNGMNSSQNENYSYSENHSNSPGSQTSPLSSEVYTRVSSESDNPNRISPTGSSVSDNKQNGRHSPKRYSNFSKHLNQMSKSSYDMLKNQSNGTGQYGGRYSPNHSQTNDNKHNLKNAISQMYHHQNNKNIDKPNFSVPIFVLHAKGSFYIPLTIDYNTLVPYLQNYNILDILPGVQNIVLHPVTINVNFQPANITSVCAPATKQPKYKNELQNGWH